MKQKIKDVNDYFVGKMLAADFKVIKFEPFLAVVEIDGEYTFNIWVANGATRISLYENGFMTNFMKLSFTDNEKQIIFDLLQSGYNEVKRQTKIREIERLNKELEELNK